MAIEHPFRGLVRALAAFILLVAAAELVIVVAHPGGTALLTAEVIGVVLALAALVALALLAATGRRYGERARQMLAGDYLMQWHYARGEWAQFVARERAITVGVAVIFLPLTLGCAAIVFVLSQIMRDPIVANSLPILLVAAAAFFGGLVYALAGGRVYARRARLSGDAYISRLGILLPDGYRPLHALGYHLAAAVLEPGSPSCLRLTLQLGRRARLLALVGTVPTQWDVRVPVPYGREAEAAQVAAQFLAQGAL